MTPRRPMALAALAAAALTAVGCSQVAAIAPVGGDHLAEVRFAAIDVLVASGTELLAAPDCTTEQDGAITCVGETLAGERIDVLSSADDPASVTVTVGDEVVYDGSIQEALEKALRPAG
jgi:hypothetical protein